MKLAVAARPGIYDRLVEVQSDLERSADGTGKPMRCSAAMRARIATLKPNGPGALARLLGDRRADRFGPASLQVLKSA